MDPRTSWKRERNGCLTCIWDTSKKILYLKYLEKMNRLRDGNIVYLKITVSDVRD